MLAQSSLISQLLPPDIFNQDEQSYDELLAETFRELGYEINKIHVPVDVGNDPEVKH